MRSTDGKKPRARFNRSQDYWSPILSLIAAYRISCFCRINVTTLRGINVATLRCFNDDSSVSSWPFSGRAEGRRPQSVGTRSQAVGTRTPPARDRLTKRVSYELYSEAGARHRPPADPGGLKASLRKADPQPSHLGLSNFQTWIARLKPPVTISSPEPTPRRGNITCCSAKRASGGHQQPTGAHPPRIPTNPTRPAGRFGECHRRAYRLSDLMRGQI